MVRFNGNPQFFIRFESEDTWYLNWFVNLSKFMRSEIQIQLAGLLINVYFCLNRNSLKFSCAPLPNLPWRTRFFVWFDSLHPINNLSVIKGQVFLGWTSTKLGLMFLLKDTTQWRRWGLNPRPLGLESSTLPLSPLYRTHVFRIICAQMALSGSLISDCSL